MGFDKETLISIYGYDITKCTDCILSQTRNKVVPCYGSKNGKLMFIGMCPGWKENETGIPFTGKSGEELIDLVKDAGISTRDIVYTNIIRCFPADGLGKYRKPKSEEIKKCRVNTVSELAAFNPLLIVALGQTAADELVNKKHKKLNVTQMRGRKWSTSLAGEIPLIVTYNPAAILYQRNNMSDHNLEILDNFKSDLEYIKREFLKRKRDNEITGANFMNQNPISAIMDHGKGHKKGVVS